MQQIEQRQVEADSLLKEKELWRKERIAHQEKVQCYLSWPPTYSP